MTDSNGNSAPDAIARLRAPAGCGSLGANGRMYTVGPDGTVDVQVYIAPRGS